MDVRVITGDIATTKADAIVVNLFEGVTSPGGATGAVDRALGGLISRVIAQGDIRGKRGELVLLHAPAGAAAPRVLVAGLGKSTEFDVNAVRDISANVIRRLRQPGIRSIATITHGAGIGGLDLEACTRALAEGALLGDYRFLRHKKEDPERAEMESLTIVEQDGSRITRMSEAAHTGIVVAEAANLARDLANEPSNHLTPTRLAEAAQRLARESGLECEILDAAAIAAKGMGSLMSVARGSHEPAKLVRLSYRGGSGDGYDLALVGKGITFDTGGISIKPAANMEAMKADMTGAASVIAAMGAIARLKPKVNVVAIAPCTENMPGGGASKPGDVVTAMNGRTIEIINTDAEGRLVLADALCWAVELGAKAIVDVATLTGAATTIMGDAGFPIMTNDDAFCAKLEAAAAAAGEKTWRLPMWKEYDDYIKSDVADQKNTGTKGAGTIVGAKFLEPFVDGRPWVHMDIACVDMLPAENGWISKGASGYSVRPMINLAMALGDTTAR
ncbi:leucyl aminopeptidase [bacterium]|nr:leucyl aminopeptidase [bacterium]